MYQHIHTKQIEPEYEQLLICTILCSLCFLSVSSFNGFTRFEKLIMVRPLAVFFYSFFIKFNCSLTLHSRCSKNNTWLHTHSRWSNEKKPKEQSTKNTHKTRKNYVQTISFVFSYVEAIKCIKNYWIALKVFNGLQFAFLFHVQFAISCKCVPWKCWITEKKQ